MLGSLGLIFIVALISAGIMKKITLPTLVGMILTGILIGPYGLDLIDDSLLNISAELRKIALVIILLRAGLSLDIEHVLKFGKGAALLSFVPALIEMISIAIISYTLLGFDLFSAMILGIVIAAVSPAVVVPRMLDLMESGVKKVPQVVVASSSIEDVIVIIIFTILSSIITTATFEFVSVIYIITGILSGLIIGIVSAYIITKVFRRFVIVDGAKVITLISVSFLFIALESKFTYFSSLIAIMLMAIIVGKANKSMDIIQSKFKEIWISAEIILFVIVGASLDVTHAFSSFVPALVVISIGLLFRSMGVILSLRDSKLTKKEKQFIMLAFIPKATVQAAIAPMAITLGLSGGESILSIAVFAILITAPLGAVLIDKFKYKLLVE